MKNLLHIAVSPRGDNSHSRTAAHQLINALHARSSITVVDRDLSSATLPHPDAAFVAASLTHPEQQNDEHKHTLALSETLIAELAAADAVVISTPMHNFMLPSALKAWVDHVVRPHRTFRSGPQGKQGLLADRPVALLLACGGAVNDAPGAQKDWATPYLRYVFNTIGIHDFQSLILENCNRTENLRQPSLERLHHWQKSWPW